MEIFEDEWNLPDRLACLPARPWTMNAIRWIAAAPRGVWETRDIEECLWAFGWHRGHALPALETACEVETGVGPRRDGMATAGLGGTA